MRLTNPHNQRPSIILDAAAVGPRSEATAKFKSPSQTQNLLGTFRSYGHVAINTARPASEALLGETDLADWALLDTTLPSNSASVTASIDKSLNALCVQRLRVAYLSSSSDANRNQSRVAAYWREAIAAVHSAHEVRKVDELGLNQVSTTDVKLVAHICVQEGWLKPAVYRGVYNAAMQDNEQEILPILREHGLRFYAIDPFSGGLCGDAEGAEAEVPAAVTRLLNEAKLQNVAPRALCLRWLLHHSALDERLGDALVLPATDLGQLEDDLRACDEGPLPEDLVDGIEALCSRAVNSKTTSAETATEPVAFEAFANAA